MLKAIRQNKQILLLFFGITITFFYKAFLTNQIYSVVNLMYRVPPWDSIPNITSTGPLQSDAIDSLYARFYYVKDQLLNLKLPLWNPHIGAGTPFYVELLTYIFYPVNWVTMIMPIEWGMFIHSLIRVFITLVGMYLFLGRLKLDQTARVIGAVIFAFSGPMIVWHPWR